jgi:hypothetical protein
MLYGELVATGKVTNVKLRSAAQKNHEWRQQYYTKINFEK